MTTPTLPGGSPTIPPPSSAPKPLASATITPSAPPDQFKSTRQVEINGKKYDITLFFDKEPTTEALEDEFELAIEKAKACVEKINLGVADTSGKIIRSIKILRNDDVEHEVVDSSSTTPRTERVKDLAERLQTIAKTVHTARTMRRSPTAVASDTSKVSTARMPHPATPATLPSATPPDTDLKRAPLPPVLTAPLANANSAKAVKHEHRFTDSNGNPLATESAQQAETVEMLLNGLKQQLKVVDNELKGMSKSDPRYAQLQAKKDKLAAQIKNCEDSKGTWASTNTPRLAFKQLGVQGAREKMAPILMNLHRHVVKDASGNVVSAINRSGAIADFSHGEVSLMELQDYNDLLLMKNAKLHNDARRAELEQRYGLPKVDHSNPRKAQKQSQLYNEKRDKVLADISKRAKLAYGITDSTKPGELPFLNPNELQASIAARKERLVNLALQDMCLHFRSPDKRQELGSPLLYSRVGLVDPTKGAKNEYGCVIHERTQAFDTQAILRELNNKEVIFDIEGVDAGPYMDDDGVIHMPRDCYPNPGRAPLTTKLNTVNFNISVQGNTKNAGIQQQINEQAIQDLEAYVQARLEILKNKKPLNGEEYKEYEKLNRIFPLGIHALKLRITKYEGDPFEIAKEIITLLESIGNVGVNCYGGKDRTGYAVALVTHSALSNAALGKITDEAQKQGLLKKWGHELVSANGIGAQIARKNADHDVFKLTRFNLKLFDVGSRVGTWIRLKQMFAGIPLAIKAKRGVMSVGKDPNQIYLQGHQVKPMKTPNPATTTAE